MIEAIWQRVTLFTFCPPGPVDVVKLMFTACCGMSTSLPPRAAFVAKPAASPEVHRPGLEQMSVAASCQRGMCGCWMRRG